MYYYFFPSPQAAGESGPCGLICGERVVETQNFGTGLGQEWGLTAGVDSLSRGPALLWRLCLNP